MKKQTLIKAIKTVLDKSTSLPIIENVLLQDGYLQITDLETTVSIPYHCSIPTCIPAEKFITSLEMMEHPIIKNLAKRTDESYSSAVFITEGKKEIKLTGEDPEQFPLTIPVDALPMNHIGTINQAEVDLLETALKFTSQDGLRPAMTGIFIGKDICATDAHRLFWKAIDPLLENIIVPAKSVKALLVFGGTWNIYASTERAIFCNEEGVNVIVRLIDARFPDYMQVIPQDKAKVVINTDLKELRSEIKNSIKFANKATSLVAFSINGSMKIHSQDVDLGHEYTAELEQAKYEKEEDMTIGFNGKFLDEILAQQDSKQPVNIKLWKPTGAAIVNDSFLIMPLMIHD